MKTRKFLPFALSLSLLLIAASTGFAQEAAEEATHEQATVWQTIKDGGPLIMSIWLIIFGTSVTMVTFVILNFLTLRVA